MMGSLSIYAEEFLRITAVLTAVVFSLPILLAPLAWARMFRWKIDPNSDLALYFGRCLGAFAVLMSCGAWYAASHTELQPVYFTVLVAFAVLMVVIHGVGALQKVQPWTETAEIPLWAGLAVCGLLFMPQ